MPTGDIPIMSSSRGGATSTAASYFPAPRGLVVTAPNGREKVVISDQEICDDIIATLPKLSAAVDKDTYGRRWKQGHRRQGVDCFELSTASGAAGDEDHEDLDVVHAVVAKAELRCHLNEVLNVLITHESSAYESTMQSLVGHKFKKGDVLFSQRRRLSPEDRRQSVVVRPDTDGGDADEAPEQALLTVSMATLRPKITVKLSARHKRTQRLCFSSFTQQYRGQDRAVHVIKTLPKAVHDQLVPAGERSSLRRELDHLAVGFHIQSTHRPGGSINQTTRVFAHGYASPTAPAQFGLLGRKQVGVVNSMDLARRREGIMNPEAKHVLNVLTKSLRQFEHVIRRRRFGFQSFIYFPVGYDDPALEKACSICSKKFTFFRRDFFCHLCGHMVCRDCSQLYEVEARIGELRKNRCCLQCVHRVDSCVFDDEDLLEALGPAVVDVDDAHWYDDDKFHLGHAEDAADTASLTSDGSSVEELTEQLYSDDPAAHSHALDFLGQLVQPLASRSDYTFASPMAAAAARSNQVGKLNRKRKNKSRQVAEDVESFLSASLRIAKDKYRPEDYVVASMERDYVLEFDESKTTVAEHPMPPMPAKRKEARRLQFIEDSGVLASDFDSSALDLIAEVAAKRLDCPIGFVSVVDDAQFHAIGRYNLPDEACHLDRTNNVCIHEVYAEKPLILKNPQRDMRFAQMPCVGGLGVKFYAGFPIRGDNGEVVASLCTADAVAHNNISTKDYATMEALAKLAGDLVKPKSAAKSGSAAGYGVPTGYSSPAFVY